jgi:hypothetical protein
MWEKEWGKGIAGKGMGSEERVGSRVLEFTLQRAVARHLGRRQDES